MSDNLRVFVALGRLVLRGRARGDAVADEIPALLFVAVAVSLGDAGAIRGVLMDERRSLDIPKWLFLVAVDVALSLVLAVVSSSPLLSLGVVVLRCDDLDADALAVAMGVVPVVSLGMLTWIGSIFIGGKFNVCIGGGLARLPGSV